uniref:Uncharacterized protein n=1 Tax=Oryza brachyantha TaxID=4533 RepID=J3LVX9_ORYBR
MVSIAAPAGGTAGRSEAVDLVLCLHHSGSSVPRKRARLLNEAVRVVVDLLGTNDRLAILPIQGALQPISDQVWVKARNELPEMAITSNLPLVTALGSAESVLFERSREERERSGHIIIISNSREEIGSQESLLPWRFQSLHALGFRSADNARAMYSIAANSRECTYGVLDDEDGRITKVLDATMKRITSMAGATMPIEVKLKCEQNAILSSIDSPLVSYFISSDKKAGIIWASALLSCSGTKFVVHLSSMGDGNFPPDNPEEWSNLLKVEVKHDQVSGKAHIKGQLQGEVVAVKKDMDGDSRSKKPKKVASKEVAAEMVRYMAVTLVTDIVATEKRDWEQLHAAAQDLCDRWATHKESSCGIEATEGGLISNLDENIKEMEIRMYNNYLWREYMLSWLSHQRWQIPLPPLFMDKQAVDELPIQLEIFAKAGTPDNQQQAHQGGLPMLLRVKVPETGLAKLKTPFVDVVMVLDKGRPRREMENQARERLQLLSKAVDVVMSKLRHKDRLAILPVDSSATTTPPKASCFLEMSNQGQRDTDNYMLDMTEQMTKVSTQNPIQTSIWRKQLNKTMKTLGNCLHISGTNTTTTTPSSSPKEQHTVSTTNSAAADGSSINQLTKAIMDARKVWLILFPPYFNT